MRPHAGLAKVEQALRDAGCWKGSGQDWTCPAHDDEHPSLGVTTGKTGKVLLNCAAGCKTADVVRALGLEMADLATPSKPKRVAPPYVYTDRRGNKLMQVVRYSDKSFRQYRWDGSRWIPGIKGVALVPYNLPTVRKAAGAGKRVFVVEGERDSDTLNALGFVATCNPMGAGKWKDSYSKHLSGAQVVIVADRDQQGYRHARSVAESVERAGAKSVSVVLPIPDHKGADVSDHLDAGHTVDDLKPVEPDELEALADGEDVEIQWRLLNGADLSQPAPPMDWLVKGLWPAGSHGAVAGEEKTLKSYFAASVAVGVAAGVPVFGRWEVPRACPVLLLVGEGGATPFRRRLQRIAHAYGVDLAGLPLSVTFDVAPLDSATFRREVDALLSSLRPGLVVLDSLYAYHPANIEAANLYTRGSMLHRLSSLVCDTGASLMVVDHFNKTGSGKGLARISQAGMKEWVDSWVLLEHVGKPDVASGHFDLAVTVGSRQWGGREWGLAYDLGLFNDDTSDHDGDIAWSVADELVRTPVGERRARDALREVLADEPPFTLTRNQAVDKAGGKKDRTRDALAAMIAEGEVLVEKRSAVEGGRTVQRERLALNDDHNVIRLGAGPTRPSADVRRDASSRSAATRPRDKGRVAPTKRKTKT